MVILDTNIFIEFLRASDKSKTLLFAVAETPNLCISAITHYELLMGATSESKKNDVKLLTETLTILPFDVVVSEKAAEIYRTLKQQNKLIEFRDIFIGATAIAHQTPLKTLNKKHFQRIEGIILI